MRRLWRIRRWWLSALVCVAAANSPAVQAKCDFLAKAPQPAWVSGSQAQADRYTGVGQADEQDSVRKQLELAKQAAIRELASNIEVSVRNDLTVSETLKTGEEAISDLQIESITRSTTDVSLAGVEVDGSWLDRKRCVLWVLVSVDKAEVKRLQYRNYQQANVTRLDDLIAQAEAADAQVDARRQALAKARALIGEIDFSALETALSRDFYDQTLARVAELVGAAQAESIDVGGQLEQARSLIVEAKAASAASAKGIKLNEARQLLRQVARLEPFGKAPDYWAEQASWELGDLETAANNPCAARVQYSRIESLAKDASWTRRARRAMRTVACSEDDQKKYVWRQRFEGQQVALMCAFDTGSAQQHWQRVCDDIRGFLASHGAAVEQRNAGAPAAVINAAQSAPVDDDDIVLVFAATGQIATRDNPRNAGVTDYQFKGKLMTRVVSDANDEFADNYSGVGGWNPISRDMAMEVLALQVSRRWQDKFYGQLVGREQ